MVASSEKHISMLSRNFCSVPSISNREIMAEAACMRTFVAGRFPVFDTTRLNTAPVLPDACSVMKAVTIGRFDCSHDRLEK